MEFFKYLWISFISILVAALIAVFRSEILALLHLDSGQIPLSLLSYILFGMGSFEFGRKWDSFTKPIDRFCWFLNKKIKQGEKLFKSNLKDVSEDYEETKKFSNLYRDWKKDVTGGLSVAFGPEHSLLNKIEGNELMYGSSRNGLEEDIKHLKFLKKEIKTDWFDKGFKPELLKEYDELKF